MYYPHLYDKLFLEYLDTETQQKQYAKITILDMNDREVQEVQGLITGGSININGSSAVRRTASLTMIGVQGVNNRITNIKNLISLKTRVRLEIGLENPKNPYWPQYNDLDILWFPLGHYIVSQASSSHNAQGLTLSLSLKDKMALLNGDYGGVLTEPLEHSPIYIEEFNDQGVASFVTSNVKYRDIIRTLLVEFGGIPEDKIIITDISNRIKNAVRWTGDNPLYGIYSKGIDNEGNPYTQYSLSTIPPTETDNLKVFNFNESIGYQYTDFTYPNTNSSSGLTSAPGETIVSVLDKIKNSLGNFEYFFDLDGYFRFQEIKNFLNQGSEIDDLSQAIGEKYFINTSQGKSIYSFTNKHLATSYSNAPQYAKIKNDIMVRGKRDSKPVRYHLVLDSVITPNESFSVVFYRRATNTNTEEPTYEKGLDGKDVWRARLAKDEEDEAKQITPLDYRSYLYFKSLGNTNFSPFSKEILEEWPKIYDIQNQEFKVTATNIGSMDWYIDFINPNDWLPKDTIDEKKFNFLISDIGRRPTVVKDDTINCVFTPQFPDIILVAAGVDSTTEAERLEAIKHGESFIQIPAYITKELGLGMTTNPAYDAIRAALHDYISYNESITIQSVPIFHLEPNTRITVKDEDSDIDGDYLIKTISIPLAHSGTMSISAVRAVERI